MNYPYVSAIIAAAGSSTRMGSKISKQFIEIAGKPVIYHTLKAFEACELINEIIVCAREQDIEDINILVDKNNITKFKLAVSGGNTRQESVINGLKYTSVNSQFISIHDGARPLITPHEIEKTILAAFENGSAAIGKPVSDTLKMVNGVNRITGTQSRENLWSVQTPQVFEKNLFLYALNSAIEKNLDFTDDCQLVEQSGKDIIMVKSDSLNLKMTTPDDIVLADMILRKRGMEMNFRIGHGYDVHKLTQGRRLIIGGVDIPYEKGLLGHSDADVLCHAVSDALLGAAGLGDIGGMFPDSSPEFKDSDSLILLQKVVAALNEKGFKIINIDATIIAQEPKMKPFIPIMCRNIALMCNIDINNINVKATTEENLGFTGAKEGISSHAVALIVKS